MTYAARRCSRLACTLERRRRRKWLRGSEGSTYLWLHRRSSWSSSWRCCVMWQPIDRRSGNDLAEAAQAAVVLLVEDEQAPSSVEQELLLQNVTVVRARGNWEGFFNKFGG